MKHFISNDLQFMNKAVASIAKSIGTVLLLISVILGCGEPGGSAPTNLRASSTGDTTVELKWDFPLSGYIFRLYETDLTTSLEKVTPSIAGIVIYSESNNAVVTKSPFDGRFSYKVEAGTLHENGDVDWNGSFSNVVVVDPAALKKPPLAPVQVSVVPTVDGVNVSWDEPENTVDFTLQRRRNSGVWDEWQTVISSYDLNTYNEIYTESGVFQYQVQACNGFGCSAYTQSSSLTKEPVITTHVPPEPIDTSDLGIISAVGSNVGTTAGQFRVNEAGAATYSIPFFAVAGVAGVTPELSIGYNSQGSNGLLGRGWSMSGLSAVTRCRQTVATEGNNLGVTWSAEDRLCLDGQKLVVVNGSSYWADGAEYRTEIDNYEKITQLTGGANYPYFKIERKDGSISYYGWSPRVGTTDSLLGRRFLGAELDQSEIHNIHSWTLSSFEDSAGNPITYHYLDDNNGQRLDQVRYAYNGNSHNAYTEMIYDDREDDLSYFLGGHEFNVTKRLSRVDHYNKNPGSSSFRFIRAYHLEYMNTASSSNKMSRLSGLQECLDVSKNNCYEPTTFAWSATSEGLGGEILPTSANHFPTEGKINAKAGDVNGDGKQDLVFVETIIKDTNEVVYDLRTALSQGTNLQYLSYSSKPISQNDTNNFFVVDYDNDGFHDLLLLKESDAGGAWRYDWTIWTGRVTGLWSQSQVLSTYTTVSKSVKANGQVLDINGDGLLDLVTQPTAGATFNYQLRTRNLVNGVYETKLGPMQTGSVPLSNGETFIVENVVVRVLADGLGAPVDMPIMADFNGDGNQDILSKRSAAVECILFCENLSGSIGAHFILAYAGRSDGTFELMGGIRGYNSMDDHLKVADINQDGFTDLMYPSAFVSDNVLKYDVFLSGGNGSFTKTQSDIQLPRDLNYLDYNKDGYLDLTYSSANSLHVRLYNSSTREFSAAVNTGLPYVEDSDTYLSMDVSGNGQPESVYFHVESPGLNAGGDADIVIRGAPISEVGTVIEEILVGGVVMNTIDYSAMTDSSVYTPETDGAQQSWWQNGSDPTSSEGWVNSSNEGFSKPISQPVIDQRFGIVLVKSVETHTPRASSATPEQVLDDGVTTVDYRYEGAKYQAGGRSTLGFHRVFSHALGTDIETLTVYRQDYPFVGMPEYSEMRTYNLKTKVSSGRSLYTFQNLNNGHTSPPYRIVPLEIEDRTYDPVGGDEISRKVTSYRLSGSLTSSYDEWGNPTRIDVANYQDGNNSVGQEISRMVTTNTYNATGLGSEYSKQFSRLSSVSVTHTRGAKTETRDTSFTYHSAAPLTGLLASEVVEPGTPSTPSPFSETKRYDYDIRGNKLRVTQEGKVDKDASVQQTRYIRHEYDDDYRFSTVTYQKIPSGEMLVEKTVSRNNLGQVTTSEDAFGVRTNFRYTGYGRLYFQIQSNGQYDHILVLDNPSSCPSGTLYAVDKIKGGEPDERTCHDTLGRVRRASVVGFDGTMIRTDTEYDENGRVRRVSEPYFANESPVWSTFDYDLLGRPTNTLYPDNTTKSITYLGRAVRIENRLNQVEVQELNALNEVVGVLDENNSSIEYQYTADGKLEKTLHRKVSTSGSADFEIVVGYDLRGRKSSLDDPDTGLTGYTYNAFGELVSQTNAMGDETRSTFDVAGRKTQRLDLVSGSVRGDTVWDYDIDIDDNPIPGKLAVESITTTQGGRTGAKQSRAIVYDSLGRVSTAFTEIDTDLSTAAGLSSFSEKTTYDEYGRVFQQFDASGSSQGIENSFSDTGYLTSVSEAATIDGVVPVKYVDYQSLSARQQVEQLQLGNGYTTTKVYDDTTGRVESISTTIAAIFQAQRIDTQWDALGNLSYRWDMKYDQKEAYCYDGMNRLISVEKGTTSASCSGLDHTNGDYQYDSFGNLTFKTGVGGYAYGSGRPHATTQAGTTSYDYDNNGNVKSDSSGREFLYTSFNKAYYLKKGDDSVDFWYGADRNRFRRLDSDGTSTLYIGNVEITIPSSSSGNTNVTVRRYIGTEVLVTEIQNSSRTMLSSKTQYLLRDHLGSVAAVMQIDGSVESMSFDAWGARRSATDWNTGWDYTGQASLIDQLVGKTNRGYTGHEMLDKIGVIHMNGRIYDATLGRFLQADPVVQSALNTQSYNRYSYVLNNPLKYNDPSGYLSKDTLGILGSIVQIIGSVLVNTGVFAPIGAVLIVAGGAMQGYAQGDMGRGVLMAVGSAAISAGIGAAFNGAVNSAGFVLASGVAGGVLSVAQGGKFGHGFVAAGLSALFTPAIRGLSGNTATKTLISSVVGGTISEATGGKFANGAVTSGFSYALSSIGSESGRACKSPCNGEVSVDFSQLETPADYQLALDGLRSLEGVDGVNQSSLGNAMFGTSIGLSRSRMLNISTADVNQGVFELRYAQSQRYAAMYAAIAVGGPLLFEAGAAGRIWWATASNQDKMLSMSWGNKGIKRLVKEMDVLIEVADDVLSGGLKARKYSTDPLPRPAYTYSAPR